MSIITKDISCLIDNVLKKFPDATLKDVIMETKKKITE